MLNKSDCIRSSYTLLELLVTISVIAILAGLLMPAFSRAKKSGNRIQCVNNLSQIGKALEMYCQGNSGFFPVNATTRKATDSDRVPLQELLAKTLTDRTIFACPDEHEQLFEAEGSSYIWNWLQVDVGGNSLAGKPRYDGGVMGEVPASSFPLISDAAAYHGPTGKRWAINVLFADGHVGTAEKIQF